MARTSSLGKRSSSRAAAKRCTSARRSAASSTSRRAECLTRTEEQVRADIVEVGRRLWERGYVASNDGNISVRLDDRRIITTPKSVSKGFMTPDMMVVTDLRGAKVAGERDPSSEIKMHLQVYRDRPDARAVVHAHPPTATGFAVAGIPLDRAVLAEVVTTLAAFPSPSTPRRQPTSCPPRAASTSKRTMGCCSRITGRWPSGPTSSPPTIGWKRSSTSRRSVW